MDDCGDVECERDWSRSLSFVPVLVFGTTLQIFLHDSIRLFLPPLCDCSDHAAPERQPGSILAGHDRARPKRLNRHLRLCGKGIMDAVSCRGRRYPGVKQLTDRYASIGPWRHEPAQPGVPRALRHAAPAVPRARPPAGPRLA